MSFISSPLSVDGCPWLKSNFKRASEGSCSLWCISARYMLLCCFSRCFWRFAFFHSWKSLGTYKQYMSGNNVTVSLLSNQYQRACFWMWASLSLFFKLAAVLGTWSFWSFCKFDTELRNAVVNLIILKQMIMAKKNMRKSCTLQNKGGKLYE